MKWVLAGLLLPNSRMAKSAFLSPLRSPSVRGVLTRRLVVQLSGDACERRTLGSQQCEILTAAYFRIGVEPIELYLVLTLGGSGNDVRYRASLRHARERVEVDVILVELADHDHNSTTKSRPPYHRSKTEIMLLQRTI